MTRLRVAHTADLDPAALTAARGLLDGAFQGEFTDADWDHTIGGLHVLLWQDSTLIGHASVVQRRLLHGGRALRTGYVEGVAVRTGHRGGGLGNALMAEAERIISGAYEVGALGATDQAAGLYTARGWQQWRGPAFALTPAGVVRTEADEGAIYVFPLAAPLDPAGALTCDWRDGDVW